MEFWDAYNENEELVGIDLIRGKVIPKGLYHLVAQVLIKHKDGDYLLMQRDLIKESYPGYYEASAGGSALKGESAIEAAIREVKEETDLNIQDIKLINKTVEKSSIYYSYLAITEDKKNAVMLQKGETINFKWINQEDFLEFVKSPDCIPTFRSRFSTYFSTLSNPEAMKFYLNFKDIHPSQLYLNTNKLSQLRDNKFDPQCHLQHAPLPIVRDGDSIYLTDGHHRAYLYYKSGLKEIPVYWDMDDLDMNFYRKVFNWCKLSKILHIRDLDKRFLSNDEYSKLWIERCQNELK